MISNNKYISPYSLKKNVRANDDEYVFAEQIQKVRNSRKQLMLDARKKYGAAPDKKQSMGKGIKLIYACSFIVILAMFTAHYIKNVTHVPTIDAPRAFSDDIKSVSPIGHNQLQRIDRFIRGKYLQGEWHYDGLDLHSNNVHVYVKVPRPLSLEPSYQRRYIRHTQCPAGDSKFWKLVNPRQVTFHLFNQDRESGIYASCS